VTLWVKVLESLDKWPATVDCKTKPREIKQQQQYEKCIRTLEGLTVVPLTIWRMLERVSAYSVQLFSPFVSTSNQMMITARAQDSACLLLPSCVHRICCLSTQPEPIGKRSGGCLSTICDAGCVTTGSRPHMLILLQIQANSNHPRQFPACSLPSIWADCPAMPHQTAQHSEARQHCQRSPCF
jgi:hypothetical protein